MSGIYRKAGFGILILGLTFTLLFSPLLQATVVWAADPIPFTPSVSELEVGAEPWGWETEEGIRVPPGYYYHGQYFDSTQQWALPDIEYPADRAYPYGYSRMLGSDDLYLVWCTRENGEQEYYVLRSASRLFLEAKEKIERYYDYLSDEEFDKREENKRIASICKNWAEAISIGAGGLALSMLAGVITAPVAVPVALISIAGAGAWYGLDQMAADIRAQGSLDRYHEKLLELERDIQGPFRQLEYFRIHKGADENEGV